MLTINKTKWKILNELSKGSKTQTELAKKLKVTLPSIHLQLKELKKEGLVKKVGEKKGKTRPYAQYSIEEGFIYFMKVFPDETDKRFLIADEDLKVRLRIWSIPQKEYHYFIENFWWLIQDYMEDIDAVILYGSVANGRARSGSDIDILLLVKKDIKKYEEKFGAFMIGTRKKGKILMAQVFRTDDFANSFEKGSDFAAEVIRNSIVIYDPKSNFIKLKNGSKEGAG